MEPDKLDDLKKQLELPQAPADLETQLKNNFCHQLAKEQQQQRRNFYLPALAASVLLTLVVSFYHWQQPPRFIQEAQAHTLHEVALQGHFAKPSYTAWRTRLGLPEATAEAELVLFKTCMVEGKFFKHLRFQYVDGNSVDLLVAQHSNAPVSGQGGDVLKGFWLTAQKESLWMLALYRDETSAERAQKLVQHWTSLS